MEAKLDYLRFTFRIDPNKSVSALDQFFSVYPEFRSPEIIDGAEIWYHYQHFDECLCCANRILILYNRVLSGGNCVGVSIPSGGLWIMDKVFHCSTFRDFIKLLVSRSNITFTRLDICFDDFGYREENHYHSASEFWEHNARHEIVSHCHSSRPVDGGSDDPDYFIDCASAVISRSHGSTFYLGSRSSDRLLRIYDKYKESAKTAKKANDPSLFIDSVRYEFELHKKYCRNFVQCLLSEDSYSFKDYISSWFRIIDRSTGTRTNTCSIDKKWQSFLDLEFSEDIDKPNLFVREKKDISFYSMCSWLKSCIPSLATQAVINGSFTFIIADILSYIDDCKFSNKHKQMIKSELGSDPYEVIKRFSRV